MRVLFIPDFFETAEEGSGKRIFPVVGAPAYSWFKIILFCEIACRLPVNLIQTFLEVSRQTSPEEATDAQEQIHRESDRYDVEAG